MQFAGAALKEARALAPCPLSFYPSLSLSPFSLGIFAPAAAEAPSVPQRGWRLLLVAFPSRANGNLSDV